MIESPRYILSHKAEKLVLQHFSVVAEWPFQRGNPNQVRVFFARESQTSGLSGEGLEFARHSFNYTVTFQKEADIYYPYGHAAKLPPNENVTVPDFGAQKTEKVLWIVSNCMSKKRMLYYQELNKYIKVRR